MNTNHSDTTIWRYLPLFIGFDTMRCGCLPSFTFDTTRRRYLPLLYLIWHHDQRISFIPHLIWHHKTRISSTFLDLTPRGEDILHCLFGLMYHISKSKVTWARPVSRSCGLITGVIGIHQPSVDPWVITWGTLESAASVIADHPALP